MEVQQILLGRLEQKYVQNKKRKIFKSHQMRELHVQIKHGAQKPKFVVSPRQSFVSQSSGQLPKHQARVSLTWRKEADPVPLNVMKTLPQITMTGGEVRQIKDLIARSLTKIGNRGAKKVSLLQRFCMDLPASGTATPPPKLAHNHGQGLSIRSMMNYPAM